MKHLPIGMLLCVLAKMLVLGTGYPESIAVVALCALYGYGQWLSEKKEPEANTKIKEDIKSIKDEMEIVKSALQSQKLTNIMGRR